MSNIALLDQSLIQVGIGIGILIGLFVAPVFSRDYDHGDYGWDQGL
jgi:hypothetical protein